MTTADADIFGLPPLNDNKEPVVLPELPSVDEIVRFLEQAYAPVIDRANAIIEKGPEFYHITNDDEDAAATEFLVKVRAAWKTAEAARVDHKSHYDDRAGAIHAFFKNAVLDPLALAPAKANERFDPKDCAYGVGVRVNMAQTIYKVSKMEAERRTREAEAQRLREEERARSKALQEAREAEERARRAAEEAAASALRKRNAETRAVADAAAAKAREEQQRAEDARRAAMEAENKAAAERAAAESAASAKAADLTRSRGGKGGVASLKEFLAVRDIERNELAKGPRPGILDLLPFIEDKALEKAAKAYGDGHDASVRAHIRAGTQPINGLCFYLDHKNAGRA